MILEINKVNKVANILSNKSQKIAIITHVNPDGDAIGSSLGLFNFLIKANYFGTSVITPNDYASFLKWMPGNDQIIIASENYEKASKNIIEADIIFCLDFNDPQRTDILEKLLKKSKAKTILIDHHPQPIDIFDYTFSYVDASSTAEIIFKFMQTIDKNNINKNIAACLYAGIITDTGSFSYGCNNPETFIISAELVKKGINPENINRLVYNTYSVNRIKLLGYCLSERLTVIDKYNTAYICLTQKDLEKFNHQEGDTEGIVNYALSIRNIHLAALFIEKKDYVKISFRSLGNIDVNYFARKYFNGGGHVKAAGGNYYDTISKTIEYFETVLAEFRKNNLTITEKLKP